MSFASYCFISVMKMMHSNDYFICDFLGLSFSGLWTFFITRKCGCGRGDFQQMRAFKKSDPSQNVSNRSSYNCLPNKKQSISCHHLPTNMGLLGSLSSKFYHDSSDHIGSNIDTEASKKLNNQSFGLRTNISLMDLVYSFTESTRMKIDRRHNSTFSFPTESSNLNCKDILTHYNSMTSLPLARSYLVGGFVGSKSQLGRRRKNNMKINLWDIIRDVLNLVGYPPLNYSQKQNQKAPSWVEKECCIMQEDMEKNEAINSSVGLNHLQEPARSQKQSYADVAKRLKKDQPSSANSENCDVPKIVMEARSSCIKTDINNRGRITSECSADSEDSFIVFECCEDENVDISDDETLSCFDEASQSDSGISPSRSHTFCSRQSPKKVRFAKGKSLVKVHPMIAWDFAYRTARRGPWEMLARDSERFKLRIAKTKKVLESILDPQHRSVVYRNRFADLVR